MLRYRVNSEEDTMDLAAALGSQLSGGECLALEGPLGAGKTCFVRGLARGMGIDQSLVSSPTFVIRQEYPAMLGLTLVHLDAYRLQAADDLQSIGFDELLASLQPQHGKSSDLVLAIEWPSRIAAALPADRIDLAFEHAGPSSRLITMTGYGTLLDLPAVVRLAVRGGEEARCRMCNRLVSLESESFPFCSERCRLADLNAWFKGAYRMSRPAEADEELTE